MTASSNECDALRRAIAALKEARALFTRSGHLVLAAHTETAIGQALKALSRSTAPDR